LSRVITNLLLIFLLLIFPCFGADPTSWDLLDENCNDISDWTDADNLNGVSEVSPAGEFRLYNTAAAGGSLARRTRDYGTTPDTFTVEMRVYNTTIGAGSAGDDDFYVEVDSDDWSFFVQWGTDGLFAYDGAGFVEIGTNVVATGEWHVWRFLFLK